MDVITLSHGSGGVETEKLLKRLILSKLKDEMKRALGGIGTDELDDGATLRISNSFLVASMDSYTVNPPFFPGGNVGELAASGTINDVLVMGGNPVAILDSVVFEEGFPMKRADEILNSFLDVLRKEKVSLIGGDLKVMPRGQLDGVLIATVGLGIATRPVVDSNLKEGDRLIITGSIGEHGAAILAAQRGFDVESEGLKSDVRTLSFMRDLISKFGEDIHAARDPTRGGLAGSLNEWAKKTGLVLVVDEERIPVREEVRAFTELLGVDPLTLACEGRALLGVSSESVEEILSFLENRGEAPSLIGEVHKSKRFEGIVLLKTISGGSRILEPPSGEIVPRIC